MKTLATLSALLLGLVLSGPVPAQKAGGLDLLADPDFNAVTKDFSAEDSLELAAHMNMAVRGYEKAIPMYEVLLKKSPGRADLWAMLAAAYNRTGEAREAFDAADIAITLAPHYPHYYAERGVAAFRLGQFESSIRDLKHFCKTFPMDARAHYYLGLAHAAHGDIDAAREGLMRARALNPAFTLPANYYLGLMAAGRGRIGAGREMLAATQRAFKDTDPALAALVARQLAQADSEVAHALRAATHASDAAVAHRPDARAAR